MTQTLPLQNKSSPHFHNLVISERTPCVFVNVQSALRCRECILFLCMVVHHESRCFWSSLNQMLEERNALLFLLLFLLLKERSPVRLSSKMKLHPHLLQILLSVRGRGREDFLTPVGSWQMKTLLFFFPFLIFFKGCQSEQFETLVKRHFLFPSITESRWSHWSETTDWETDEWVQCFFPLCSVTSHSWFHVFCFCYCNFCNGCR